MGNFNKQSAARRKAIPDPDTTNLAGGKAYAQSNELELVSLLITSFAQDQYYRNADETFARLKELIAQTEKKFVAKAAIYARNVFGMRSITHVAAAELARYIGGEPWAKHFYERVVFRPDDMLEIAAYYLANCADVSKQAKKRHKKDLTNQMKKGFAAAFDKFNNYQIAKYKGAGKEYKMIDLINLVHPTPNDGNIQAITKLVKGESISADTWEVALTKAGQQAENEEDLTSLKADAWKKLIEEKKIGYLALLRNLRNIMEQAPGILPLALVSLTTESFIKKSKIFPFQYLIAYKQFLAMNTKESRLIVQALSNAIEISCQNVKELGFEGETLIAIDNSGSMNSPVAKSEHMMRSEAGGLFGIVLGKAINADLMEFGDYARYINYKLNENCMDFAADFHNKNKVGHGTNYNAVFESATKKYDRIVFFSDGQGWVNYGAPVTAFHNYRLKHKANPFIYSFDLAAYGTMMFPEDRQFCIAGFSDKIFSIMAMLEKDRNALVNEVKAVDL